MNIALKHIQAAASASVCGRNAFVRAVVLGCAVACASVPALATDRDRDRDPQRNNPPQQQVPPANREAPRERMAPQPQPAPQRQADMQHSEQRQYEGRVFDTRAEEQRRQSQQQEQRRPGRLTPDERRELRRQINEAGMDLYPNTPRR